MNQAFQRRGAAVERSQTGSTTGVTSDGPGVGDLLSMGMALATCVIVGFGLGWLLDLALGSFPACALAGLFVGIVGAGVYFYKVYKTYS